MSVRTLTFPNGFRLIYEKKKTKTTDLQVLCDIGSIHEPDGLRGVSHMIEHMCFKGTTHRTIPMRLHMEYDNIGAYMNAFTDKPYTGYIIQCDSIYTENMIQLVSDMVLNSIFDKTQFRLEEKVVIEESARNKDDPTSLLFRELNSVLYKGSVYENDIDCSEYHEQLFDYDRVIDYYKRMYRPERMLVSIVTGLPFEDVKRFVSKSYFARTRLRSPCETISLHKCVSYQAEPYYRLIPKASMATIHLAIGFRTNSIDRYALTLLQNILSGPNTARMFLGLREENGLTYTAWASNCNYDTVGDIMLYAQTDSTRLMKNGKKKKGVLPIIVDILTDLRKHGVRQSELDTTKGFMRGRSHNGNENGSTLCNNNAIGAMLYPSEAICPYAKVYETYYHNITKPEVDEVIRKYIRLDNMTVCMIGDHLPKLKDIQHAFQIMD